MTEECISCNRGVTKYVLFEISELEDLEENDCELKGHYEFIVCSDCWAMQYKSFLPGTH